MLSPPYCRSVQPIVREGTHVSGRLSHELTETPDGWWFHEAKAVQKFNNALVYGFGIPFLIAFAGILSWVIHSELKPFGAPPLSWPIAVLIATVVTTVCGGTPIGLVFFFARSQSRRCVELTIPRDGEEVELDLPHDPIPDKEDRTEGLKWMLIGPTERHVAKIPRNIIHGIQLCPWKAALGSVTIFAVQALLILKESTQHNYVRVPIMLSQDFAGAAKLMQSLAGILKVPYLFHADEEGWKQEKARAKKRPPLQCGSSTS